ncbi:Gfo/Idh/MocA family oxidoreductase [Paucilactobacillus suebicus]|uniref:Oxidoreductase n=1 Tax=Paucilactobacillus suebicus DSM 5007 = KCTC 3549 TaxID=1423807 RepID=A0A0R1WEN9_9LACO|nr:Gfo/Idh/MocA family oxidoreductase [Paucilactobacillus suebicus]KRM13299.1 oxidoreductase [Paucilactobacillus suebicus DSM 5007 = KCTC 3549]
MLKLGIIGTHWITDQFIDATVKNGHWQLTSVYSRNLQRARDYGEPKHATEFFDDLDNFFNDGSFDVVYIASPNVLHYQQVRLAIENDKHVIIEKPAFTNPDEFSQIEALLQAHPTVRLIEAARHVHTPLFAAVKDQLNEMNTVQGATFTFMKYSSRYDQVLAGETPNVFSPEFAGGALQDLGVYPIYAAAALFGEPDTVVYFPTMIDTGADGKGGAVLKYPDFEVTLNFGKIANSHMPSEIYGLKDTLVMDNIADMTEATYFDENQKAHKLDAVVPDNSMSPEVDEFTKVLEQPNDLNNLKSYETWFKLSRLVNSLTYSLRESAGIKFPNEQ